MDADSLDSVVNLAWLKILRREATTREELPLVLGVDELLAGRALDELFADGRVAEVDGRLVSQNLVLPLGAEHGWEAAVLDHFRTITVAIATKLRRGLVDPALAERIGGSTFTFTVEPGQPNERAVYALLSTTRRTVQALWDKVSDYNREHPPSEDNSTQLLLPSN